MAIGIGNACSGESGALSGNEPGNQRKLKKILEGVEDFSLNDEVRINAWVDLGSDNQINKRPLKWVFRFIKPEHREAIARAMIAACQNPYVGYDQDKRDTYRSKIGLYGYSIDGLSKVAVPCDCDCSSLVSLCFFCATGKDIGSLRTYNLADGIRKTGLCTEITTFSSATRQTGLGLEVGDICIWRNESSGHAAVVVSTNYTAETSYNQDNIPWISGITNIVATDEERIYGQDKKRSLTESTGAFRIYALNKDEQLKEISKVVAVDSYGVPRYIYGYSKTQFAFNMIGDSRTVQLGSQTQGRNAPSTSLLYGIIPDKNIFAWWGCKLVELSNHTITRTQYTVQGVVSQSSYSDREETFTIWLKNGSTEKAFQILNASTQLDLSSYQVENALVDKVVTVTGYAENYQGALSMLSYEELFSPADDYSCPIIVEVVDNASQSSQDAKSISQIATILNDSSKVYKKFSLSSKARELIQEASKSDLLSASFWFGINDVQIYKDAFSGDLAVSGQTQAQSRTFYIKSFVEEYARLIDKYLSSCQKFNNSSNYIYISSIVSTSKNEKDYYDGQGLNITAINSKLNEWVQDVQLKWWKQNQSNTTSSDYQYQGFRKEDCWLQYIEINIGGNGKTATNAQNVVKNSDFRDNIHFTREWFENNYLPRFNFSSMTGDIGEYLTEDEEVNYTAQAPKDWPCESDDINFYIKEYPKRILDFLTSRGYPVAFVIGIIANMRHESYFKPSIKGDFNTKLRIYVDGVPAPTTGGWVSSTGYNDGQNNNSKCCHWRTNTYTSYGFCQWHNTQYLMTNGPANWQTNGLSTSYKESQQQQYGDTIQSGRGKAMMNYCLNTASYKAPWYVNPIGQLEYLMQELQGYPSIWQLRNTAPGNISGARQVATEFCLRFEQPPNKEELAKIRADSAEKYWNWLILGKEWKLTKDL